MSIKRCASVSDALFMMVIGANLAANICEIGVVDGVTASVGVQRRKHARR